MKRTIIVLTILFALILSGCLCPGPSGDTSGGVTATTVKTGGVTATTVKTGGVTATTVKTGGVTATTVKSSGGVVSDALSSLAGAISSGQAYKCTYNFEGYVSEMWVQGDKYHSKSTVNGQISHAVSDGVWMYSWQEGANTGIKFNIAEMKSLSSENQQTSGASYTDLSDIADAASNVQCTPTVITPGTFSAPSNVQFQDMGEVLRQLQQLSGQMTATTVKSGGAGGTSGEGDVGGDIQSTLCDACAMMPPGNPACSKCT